MKRPSTLLRKKKELENYKKSFENTRKAPTKDVELKMTSSPYQK